MHLSFKTSSDISNTGPPLVTPPGSRAITNDHSPTQANTARQDTVRFCTARWGAKPHTRQAGARFAAFAPAYQCSKVCLRLPHLVGTHKPQHESQGRIGVARDRVEG